MRFRAATVALFLSALCISPALAQGRLDPGRFHNLGIADVIVPIEWQGVWESVVLIKDCETGDTLFLSPSTDTLCAGSVSDQYVGYECTGTATSTTYDFSCVLTDVSDTCTTTTTIQSTGTRTGDTYTSVAILTVAYEGSNCPDPFPVCFRIETSATRTSTTVNCSVPVENATWSLIKARYGEKTDR